MIQTSLPTNSMSQLILRTGTGFYLPDCPRPAADLPCFTTAILEERRRLRANMPLLDESEKDGVEVGGTSAELPYTDCDCHFYAKNLPSESRVSTFLRHLLPRECFPKRTFVF